MKGTSLSNDTRAQRRFPGRRAWRTAVPTYSNGNLELHGFQVMQTWEAELMAAMASDVTRRNGRVLEIGFGLGIAAREIRRFRPDLHVIIEANAHIAASARQTYRREISRGAVQVIDGFWEDVVSALSKKRGAGYDGILFDTFPLHALELRRNHYAFFPVAHQLLVNGGKFTYFSDEVDSIGAEHQQRLMAAFGPRLTIHVRSISVRPPPNCEYWTARSILHLVVTKR
jgi:guanidinoacetate N-methyltransferase